MKIGIQGGRGSFNEEAAKMHIKSKNITNYQIIYLHTTENVLKALEMKEIDIGQFAIFNTLAGDVQESIDAMKKHSINKIDEFKMRISHCLMKRDDVEIRELKTVMSHPHAILQCKNNLAKKYPNITPISGYDELIDQAKVAELIKNKILDKTTATLGSVAISQVYGLDIVEKNMEDNPNNITTFYWVK